MSASLPPTPRRRDGLADLHVRGLASKGDAPNVPRSPHIAVALVGRYGGEHLVQVVVNRLRCSAPRASRKTCAREALPPVVRLTFSLIGPFVPSDAAAPPPPARLLGLTARIVSAHASRNLVAANQLPELIRSVHRALGGLGQDTAPAEPARPEPAVPIRRSVQHDRIICLECGAAMSMLKRHLSAEHHLTPEGYRERWGLPRGYPLVAPRYAAVRSGLARRIGLGRKRGGQAQTAPLALDAPDEMPDARMAAPDMAEAELQGAGADTEPAAPAAKGRGRKRAAPLEGEALAEAAAPDTSASARGRGRRRAKNAGAG